MPRISLSAQVEGFANLIFLQANYVGDTLALQDDTACSLQRIICAELQ